MDTEDISSKINSIMNTTDEKIISLANSKFSSSNMATSSPFDFVESSFDSNGKPVAGDSLGLGKLASKLSEQISDSTGLQDTLGDITGNLNNLTSKLKELGISDEDVQNMASKTFSAEDRKIAILQMEIQEIKKKIEADEEYINKTLKGNNAKQDGLINKLSEFPANLKKELEELNSSLKKAINPSLNIEYVDAIEVLLTNMVDTFTKALEPFLQVPNMPQIPIIGDLADILKTLSEMGRIQRMINSNLSPAEREKWKKQQEEKNKNTTVWQRIRDSKAGQLIREIANTIWEIIKLLPMIINFFWLALIKELLDLLKPVFQSFGIVAGTYMGLIESVPDFLTSSWNMAMTFGYMLLRIAWGKVEEVFNIFMLVGSVETDAETQEKIIKKEIKDFKKEIKKKEKELTTLKKKKQKEVAEKMVKKLEKAKKRSLSQENLKLANSTEEIAKKAIPATT